VAIQDDGALHLALLGDSIAYGQGASRPEDRLGARLVRAIEAHGLAVECHVVASPGARSADLAGQLDTLVEDPPAVAVVVIGANDLLQRVPAKQAAAHLDTALARLRSWGCEVVVAVAPDLSTVPALPAKLRGAAREASLRLRHAQASVVRRRGARLADADQRVSALFAGDQSLFCSDLFHPSSKGYAVISAALLPVVLDAVEAAAA
jgi:lysophospholipase L1-like esterase